VYNRIKKEKQQQMASDGKEMPILNHYLMKTLAHCTDNG
jgi:hypothetical protein